MEVLKRFIDLQQPVIWLNMLPNTTSFGSKVEQHASWVGIRMLMLSLVTMLFCPQLLLKPFLLSQNSNSLKHLATTYSVLNEVHTQILITLHLIESVYNKGNTKVRRKVIQFWCHVWHFTWSPLSWAKTKCFCFGTCSWGVGSIPTEPHGFFGGREVFIDEIVESLCTSQISTWSKPNVSLIRKGH